VRGLWDTQSCKGVTRRVAQSLSRILVHLVFSTKNREPTVHSDVRHACMPTS